MDRIHFYVPCMTGFPDRSANARSIMSRLTAAGSSVTVMRAVDGRTFDQASYEASGELAPANDPDGYLHDMYNRPMGKGQLGCALSHVAALKAIRTQQEPYGVVIEDDVGLLEDFERHVCGVVANVMDKFEFDMVNLYAWPQDKEKLGAATRQPGEVVMVPFMGYAGAQCILYRKASIPKVLMRILPIRNPYDDQIACVGLKYATVLNLEFVTHGEKTLGSSIIDRGGVVLT